MKIVLGYPISALLQMRRASQWSSMENWFATIAPYENPKQWERLIAASRFLNEADQISEYEHGIRSIDTDDDEKRFSDICALFSHYDIESTMWNPAEMDVDARCQFLEEQGFDQEQINLTEKILDVSAPTPERVNIDANSLGLFITPDKMLNRMYLNNQERVNASNMIATLALVGIETCLPEIYVTDPDEINELKTKYSSERQKYLNTLRRLVRECHEGIQNNDYKDVLEYADIVTNQQIMADLSDLKNAMGECDSRLISRIGSGIIRGIPTIASATVDPSQSVLQATTLELLRIFCESYTTREREAELINKYPLASYIYRLRESSERSDNHK